MDLEKGDKVVLHDKHSEYDGEVGEIAQISETMFGDENYTIKFEDGQEPGIPADSIEPASEEDLEDESDEAQAESADEA